MSSHLELSPLPALDDCHHLSTCFLITRLSCLNSASLKQAFRFIYPELYLNTDFMAFIENMQLQYSRLLLLYYLPCLFLFTTNCFYLHLRMTSAKPLAEVSKMGAISRLKFIQVYLST